MIRVKNILTLLLLSFIICVSCKYNTDNDKNKDNDKLIIDLKKEKSVGPFLRTLSPFTLTDKDFSDFNFEGRQDSMVIQKLTFISPKTIQEYYDSSTNQDEISKKDFVKDLYAISGFENGEQFYILDKNNNKDFRDDIKVSFSKKLGKRVAENLKERDSFEVKPTIFNYIKDNRIIEVERNFRFFPYPGYFQFKNPTPQTNLYNRLQIVAETNEYWRGVSENENYVFKVALNNSLTSGDRIVIAENGESFPKTRNSQYFKHRYGDTLKIGNTYFRIDSTDQRKSSIFFTKLNDLNGYFGYLTDDYIKNVRFKDVRGKEFSVKDVFGNKDYIIMDFWGTWCAPCKQLTPKLVEMNANSTNFNIISIAFENSEDRDKVIDYTKKNKMFWTHAFEVRNKLNFQTSFVHNLKINTFPTFIVLNKDLQIIYRGFGGDALDEAEKLLKDLSL